MPEKLPIAILISGSGTNLQALLDASSDVDFGCEIVSVVSDRPDARGLQRADAVSVRTAVVEWEAHPDRSSFTTAICDTVEAAGARALVLAGFMRILSEEAIARFPDSIINIHPSLLPAYPGAHAVEQALESDDEHTGVTVHFVDELVDNGPIIAQSPVPIRPDDTVDTLHARLQEVEHQLLPTVVSAFGRGDITVTDGHVNWQPPMGVEE